MSYQLFLTCAERREEENRRDARTAAEQEHHLYDDDDDDDDDDVDDDDDEHQFDWNSPKSNPPAAESSKAERAEEINLGPNTGNQSPITIIDQLGPTGKKIVVLEWLSSGIFTPHCGFIIGS